MTSDDLTILNWDIEWVEGNRVVRSKVEDVETLPEGRQFSVSGHVPETGFLYVIEIDDDERVAVLFPAGGQAMQEPAGTHLKLPSSGQRFVAPFSGTLDVVLAPAPVDASEWPDLIDGRDPHPKNTTGRDL